MAVGVLDGFSVGPGVVFAIGVAAFFVAVLVLTRQSCRHDRRG
jgi:hypothetical protein